MANTANSVMTPQLAVLGYVDLTAATAGTTRAPLPIATVTGATTVYFPVSPTLSATADTKISKISLKGASTSFTAPTAAQTVLVWISNGTTVRVEKEITVSLVTPSTTSPSFEQDTLYDDFVVPAGYALYLSTSITTTAATTALVAVIHGASM